ncbi:MAG TPA: carboxymuconolactone decarboxylase family protein [Alphaproteobacteria bacterium]|jgi:alkylhydroperoxidase family enzyme
MPRLAPLAPPYAPDIDDELTRLMPPGMAPIALFRTVAHNPRVLARWRGGALLDKGSITLRQRELLILRTTARLGAEYEWGVHIAYFADKAGFSPAERAATVHGGPEAWRAEEAVLVRIVDALVDEARLGDALWQAAMALFSPAQLVEILSLVGLYHMVSFVVIATEVAREPGAPGFPAP